MNWLKNTKIAFEDKLVRTVLIGCCLPLAVGLGFLAFSGISVYLKCLLALLMLTSIGYTTLAVRQLVLFQLRTSTNLVEAMITGDYSIRANNKHIDGALADFNDLLNSLADKLTEQSLITKEQQILLTKVTDQIDVAIIAVDESQAITLMNPAAEALFRRRFEQLEGWPAKELGLQEVVTQALDNGIRKVTQFEINQTRRKVYVRTDNYIAQGKSHVLIFITDIQNLLRQEERQAWQRLLRVLSHEINNSLAPIASISETLLSQVNNVESSSNELMKEGLEVVKDRALSLNHFIQEYRQLTHLPTPNKQLFSIKAFCQKLSQLFERSSITYPEHDLEVFADREQLQQALVNLMKNAEEANLQAQSDSSNITLNWFTLSNLVYLEVIDRGVGISNQDNIFVPFYTTKKKGSGIGLALSRQIALNHGGDLTLENNPSQNDQPGKGAKAVILLPNAEP